MASATCYQCNELFEPPPLDAPGFVTCPRCGKRIWVAAHAVEEPEQDQPPPALAPRGLRIRGLRRAADELAHAAHWLRDELEHHQHHEPPAEAVEEPDAAEAEPAVEPEREPELTEQTVLLELPEPEPAPELPLAAAVESAPVAEDGPEPEAEPEPTAEATAAPPVEAAADDEEFELPDVW